MVSGPRQCGSATRRPRATIRKLSSASFDAILRGLIWTFSGPKFRRRRRSRTKRGESSKHQDPSSREAPREAPRIKFQWTTHPGPLLRPGWSCQWRRGRRPQVHNEVTRALELSINRRSVGAIAPWRLRFWPAWIAVPLTPTLSPAGTSRWHAPHPGPFPWGEGALSTNSDWRNRLVYATPAGERSKSGSP